MTAIPLALAILCADDGTLDGVMCTEAYVHLEMLNDRRWTLIVMDAKTGATVHVDITSQSNITATVDQERRIIPSD